MEIIKVIWKDEGEFGPVTLFTQEDLDRRNSGKLGIPFDPNRAPPKWYSREEAMAIAAGHGAEFEES